MQLIQRSLEDNFIQSAPLDVSILKEREKDHIVLHTYVSMYMLSYMNYATALRSSRLERDYIHGERFDK